MSDTGWCGTYLSEDEIVADMLAKIKGSSDGVDYWLKPMQVRRYYGLWDPACPYALTEGEDLEIVDGIITDPRHPDNMSRRIVDRVREMLRAEAAAS